MTIADSLLVCNTYFRELAGRWERAGQDARTIHVKVADRFSRIAYQVVAGRQTFRHPCTARWDYIAEKAVEYTILQTSEYKDIKFNKIELLNNCFDQLPESARAEELQRLRRRGSGTSTGRSSALWAALAQAVLAERPAPAVESPRSGESFSEPPIRSMDPHHAVCPRGAKP